jgi:hypothetical protein
MKQSETQLGKAYIKAKESPKQIEIATNAAPTDKITSADKKKIKK